MPILLDQIRGLSDSKFSGIAGSVAAMVGLDIHSTPGLLKVHQKLTKETSGTEPDEFCRVKVACSNGYSFWFSYTSGKIWARTSAGVWSLAYTTVPAAGSAGCLGAMEYNGYVYWATQSRLHRIVLASADDAWPNLTGAGLNWATFSITDTSWHPMAKQDNRLFIGDGYYVAEVDEDGVFDDDALDIQSPYRIKSMTHYELDILLGTFIAATVNKTEVIRWDCVSPSWNTSDPIEEVGINAFIRDDNYVYAQAGRAGNIYFYNGEQLEPFKKIPGDYSNVKYGEVYPDSVGNFKGVPVFGFSNSPEAGNSTGNPALQGVYSFGSYSRDYPKVLDLSWVISQDKTASIEIGAILVADFDLLVAWKDGTNYGVDKIDYTTKYASAYFETMMLFQEKRDIIKTLKDVYALYETLPASCGITFSYKINHGSYVAMTSVTDSVINKIYVQDANVPNVGSLQIKVQFTTNANNAPTLEVPLGAETSE